MAGNNTARRFSPLIHHLTIFTTLFLFLPKTCLSIVDKKYLDCVPQTCGHGAPNISYPFYIKGQQKSYCGYPGFELSCNTNNHAILDLSRNSYMVHNIFYKNQSLRISNAEFSDKMITCFRSIQNLTLYGNHFELAFNYPYLYFLSNCPSNSNFTPAHVLSNCPDDRIPTDKKQKYILVRVDEDPSCSDGMAVPAELYGDDSNRVTGDWEYYLKVLRKGVLLNWTTHSSECSVCQKSGGRCGFDEKTDSFNCFCPDRPYVSNCPPRLSRKIKNKAAIAASAAGFGILIIIGYCCYSRKFFSPKSLLFWKKKKQNLTHQNVEAFLKNTGSVVPKRYSYSDIKKMTNSFKEELGKGGFGSVYKGKLQDNCLVAVKILNNSKEKNGEEFVNELASISRTSHVNIVTLLGFCFDGSHRALIYEFMPNGSLEKFIYNEIPMKSNRQLGWETLYRIAIGIARGLEYLHRGCNTRILHFDIKPHNILLDDDFCPKISDFGLAKLCPKKESIISMLGARGTVGYIAPEVFCRTIGGVCHKSDVYSFGMMVLEMVGVRNNINVGVGVDHTSEIYFPHWIYNRLESSNELGLRGVGDIMNEEENEKAKKLVLVSLWCIQTDPYDRPPMSRVLEMLEGKIESLRIPPRPFLSSSSSSKPFPGSSTTPEADSQDHTQRGLMQNKIVRGLFSIIFVGLLCRKGLNRCE